MDFFLDLNKKGTKLKAQLNAKMSSSSADSYIECVICIEASIAF